MQCSPLFDWVMAKYLRLMFHVTIQIPNMMNETSYIIYNVCLLNVYNFYFTSSLKAERVCLLLNEKVDNNNNNNILLAPIKMLTTFTIFLLRYDAIAG